MNTVSFYHWEGNNLILNILGNAGAKRDLIGKIRGNELKVSVKKAPEDGKATMYMMDFLAKKFGVSSSEIQVLFGQTSIHKQIKIIHPKIIPEELKEVIKKSPE